MLVLLLSSFVSFAQLPDFTFTVTPTPQTCLGNGALNFTVAGTQPGATKDYAVYLLPNTTTPVTTVTTNSATGLVAGNYTVIATQSLGGQTSTAAANVTIQNQVIPLSYTLTATKTKCGNDGKITVNMTSGAAVSYEIINGPITVPQQASNVFNNLPVGVYEVRVYNDCGEAVVVTTQVTQDQTNIYLGQLAPVGGALPDCNTISMQSEYSLYTGGNNIFWPLTFQYTVHPPGGGAAIVLSKVVAGGSLTDPNTVLQDIPFYHDQQYSVDIKVTDACGNVWNLNNNIINQHLSINFEPDFSGCGERSFKLTFLNYVNPVTVNFTDVPAEGFVPADFNPQHPLFSDEAEYKIEGTPVPLGSYTVVITDGCGREFTQTFELTEPILMPEVIVQAECGDITGDLELKLPGRTIVWIELTTAPVEYGPSPVDLTSMLDEEGKLVMNDLPFGPYLFTLTDECGVEYTKDVTIEVTSGSPNMSALQRPGCEEGFGTVRLNAQSDFTNVSVTDGPVEFSTSYPVDVTANIAGNGDFYMNGFPAGLYEFSTMDECGIERIKQVDVEGYLITVDELEVIPYCGSFRLDLQHQSNGNYVQSFWLQRYNPGTATWGHPDTNTPYTSGLPNTTNSVYMNINDNSTFYFTTGDFRIIKTFYTYANGNTSNNLCFNVLHEFTFSGGPVITEVVSFPCAGGLTEVAVQVEGVPPFEYSITTKDGDPFVIDNGASNIFSELEPAFYNFRVTDACGNIVNSAFNINATDPLEITASGFCEGEDSFLMVPPYSFLNYQWYAANDPGTILSTANSLTFPSFNSATDTGVYMVNITTTNASSCMNTTLQYEIQPNQLPNAGADNAITQCNDGASINLTSLISGSFDTGGTWLDTDASGALNGNMFDIAGVAAGTYNFTYRVTGLCSTQDESVITITLNETPDVPTVAAVAPVCEGTDVQLSVTPVAGVAYSWTGPNGFTSSVADPLLTGAGVAASGVYSVTASADGCTSAAATVTVTVNSVPDFTINGATALCTGQSLALNVAPDNFTTADATYVWYFNGVEQAGVDSDNIIVDEIGVYSVNVSLNGCESSREVTITPNSAAFDVVVEGGCTDFEYILSIANITEMTGAGFVWSGPDGYSYVGEEANISGLPSGEYAVVVTNTEGCSAIGTIQVDNTSCMIPRGISPNDDEYNQSFDLSNLGVADIQIFNRYGLQVYEKQIYVNVWYGQSDKGELPTGTYFYVVTLNEGRKMTGWVYLQREIK